ncbi:MAG: hypothetical protein [Caudoviricetes sp.]|jgi:hypothetical protein|nr:MAG: hypothetical protein [Caudoviricetes sp.]
MKVYIGGYPNTWWSCQIHHDYMNKKYNYEWKESNTKFEKLLEKCEDAIQWTFNNTINHIVKHRERKISVRIDREDTWGMDHTLAYIILPMLKQLKGNKHGSPYIDAEDIPENMRLSERETAVFDHGYYDKTLNATEEEIEAASVKFHAQWVWVMDQMIWSFEQELDEENDHKNYYDPYEPGEIVEDDSLFGKDFRMKMGKFNTEKHKAYQARKQLGFTLFGKYYQSLWD